MGKGKFVLAATAIVLSITPYKGVLADTLATGAAHSINNDTVGVDYKLTEDEQKAIVEMLRQSSLASLDKDESDKYVNADGYVIEAAFKWTDIAPVKDMEIGLELQINDAEEVSPL